LKNEYYKEKNKYINDENLLKERTKNLLKFLKSSEIPFILCYFPKEGGEFPFDFFGNKPIILKKIKKEIIHININLNFLIQNHLFHKKN
jgi:hypothetical protein